MCNFFPLLILERKKSPIMLFINHKSTIIAIADCSYFVDTCQFSIFKPEA